MTDNLTVAEVLTKAADLIEPEGAWTQGALSRSVEGSPVNGRSDKAVCWCAVGAIYYINGADKGAIDWAETGLPEASPLGLRPLSAWNDAPGRTQAEVVAKLREAAERAKGGDQ